MSYDWLENLGSERVAAWIEEQNRRFREFVGDLPGELYPRLRELYSLPFTSAASPFKGGFCTVTREAGGYAVKLYDAATLSSRVVLSSSELGEDALVSSCSPTPDGKLLGVTYHKAGSDYSKLLVVDAETGERVEDTEGYISAPVWVSRDKFLYVRSYRSGKAPDGVEAPTSRVLLRELGGGEEVVFGHGLPTNWFLSLTPEYEEGYVYAVAHHGWTRSEIYEAPLGGGEWRKVYSAGEARAYPVGRSGGWTYVLSYAGSGLGEVLRVGSGEEKVVPAGRYPLEDAALTGGLLLASRLVDGASRLEAYTPGGEPLGEVELGGWPGSATILSAGWGLALVRWESFDTPSLLYAVEGGRARPVEGARLDLGLEVRDVWVTSRDGTRVHAFEVRSTRAPDSRVAVVYGYGGFALSVKPRFYPEAAVLLERGATFVSTNLRGGGEYGEEWHRAGMRERKVKVFEDFEAFLEHYKSRGYRVVATGRSNGGLLVAAAVVRRPELLDAALIGYPLTDMLRFHLLYIGRLWTTEYGDPEKPEDRAFLEAYSPLHNVKDGRAYPHVLCYTGLSDDRVHPAHALKFTARLLDAGAPAYLRVETRSGHLGATPEVRALEAADTVAFALKALQERN